MTLKEKFAQKMLDEKLDFLPIEESLELLNSGEKVETRLNWIAYIEEVADGYDCDIEDMFKELEEAYGIYDDSGKISKYTKCFSLKENDDDSFDREICPAPTYIDLIT